MKRIIILLCLALAALATSGQGIEFRKGLLKDALAQARKENKIVFVDIYAVWCGPCKFMSEQVFKEKKVGEFMNSRFVSMKIDSERGEGPSVKTRYNVEGLPTYLFLDGDGNIVFRSGSRMTSEKFIETARTALISAHDPNSVAVLAARYEQEKNNETFLRTYLEKLKETKAGAYYHVTEQYLKVQKSMKETDREMVEFLYNHANSLVFGGEADRIMFSHFGTDSWDPYARKKIREKFQKMPEIMAENTTEYAIMVQDSSLLDLSIRRAKEEGMPIADGQKEKLLVYFYKQTRQGEKYKKAVKPEIDGFIRSMNVKELQEGHKSFVKEVLGQGRLGRSFAMKNCEILRMKASEFSQFANCREDLGSLMEWAGFAIKLLPDEPKNKVFLAKVLYMNGEKEKGTALLEKVMKEDEMTGLNDTNKADLKTMKKGGEIRLL